MLETLLNFNTDNQFSLQSLLLSLTISFVLGFVISWVYKKTHRGISYSQSFLLTLLMLSIIGALLMMVIGNSLARAFAVFGGFSIVRFRSAIKDTKDIAYVFFSLVMGMGVGTQNYTISIVGTLFICLIIIILTKYNFGSIKKHNYILSFTSIIKKSTEESYLSLFEKYIKDKELLNITAPESDKFIEVSYNIKFYDDYQVSEFINKLKKTSGIKRVDLLSSKRDIEY
ncbi:DUF4956 domain-containing protein [Patescibacteria group bacterium]